MSQIQVPLVVSEETLAGYASVLVTLTYTDSALAGFSALRTALVINEPLLEGYSTVRTNLLVLEALIPVAPEPFMSNLAFPGFGNLASDNTKPAASNPSAALPGLSFSIHKKPEFKTRISEAASGREARLSLTDMPRWQFEIPYEFLEDSSGLKSSLKQLMGFFLAMRGSFDTFLVKDPDDYTAVSGNCGTGNGGTLQFPIRRTMGGMFDEVVGQIDTSNTVAISYGLSQTAGVPGAGPYTITVTNSAAYIETLSVTIAGTALTKVTGAPAAMQYAVAAGVYTFNAAQASASAVIRYRYTAPGGDYTVTMPNQLVFGAAVASGTTVYFDGQFYFVCRFLDDTMDFEKFMHQIWSVGAVAFRSVIQ